VDDGISRTVRIRFDSDEGKSMGRKPESQFHDEATFVLKIGPLAAIPIGQADHSVGKRRFRLGDQAIGRHRFWNGEPAGIPNRGIPAHWVR
jgi:hypothetical protein